jgi:dynein assembly factor with WDR repeat domains 1
MDQTAKLWDVETGKLVTTLSGHEGEIVSLHFNAEGDKILTGSFDRTAMVNKILIIIKDMGCSNW